MTREPHSSFGESSAPIVKSRAAIAERILAITLTLTVLDTAYLSWRYLALEAGQATPGTGLCSWSAFVDCDKVLSTPQARAFYVPNALLGLGFYTGCWLWWMLGTRWGAPYRWHLLRALVVWLGVASVITLWFWWLLLHLPALCPLCPWNHVLTYVALAAAIQAWRQTPRPGEPLQARPLLVLGSFCVGLFLTIQVLWLMLRA